MSLKYRTGQGTSASDFTDLVVKVGDTLPIGTEVDYDGQTVPAGWQEVAETNLGDVVVDSIRTKNMFDGVVTNAYIDTQGVLQNASDWEASLNYIPVKQNTEYIVTASNMGARFIYAEYDSNRTVIGTRKEITPATPFTTSSTTKYVRFCTNNANATNIQLEEGDTATTYSLYQELNNQDVYSTVEQRVGTWIDGKPIYRKYVSGTTPNNSTTDLVLNVDTLVNFNIIVLRTNNNQWHPITSAMTGFDQNHACPVYYVISTTRVSLFINNSAYASQPYKGWVEYTKTTD